MNAALQPETILQHVYGMACPLDAEIWCISCAFYTNKKHIKTHKHTSKTEASWVGERVLSWPCRELSGRRSMRQRTRESTTCAAEGQEEGGEISGCRRRQIHSLRGCFWPEFFYQNQKNLGYFGRFLKKNIKNCWSWSTRRFSLVNSPSEGLVTLNKKNVLW